MTTPHTQNDRLKPKQTVGTFQEQKVEAVKWAGQAIQKQAIQKQAARKSGTRNQGFANLQPGL
jgi:hypothetical protein